MKYCLLSIIFFLFINSGYAQPGFQMTIDIGPNDEIVDIARTSSGEFVTIGQVYGSDFDLILLRISSTGTILDSKRLGTSQDDIAESICILSDGGFLITGYSRTTLSDNDALIVRTDSMLNVLYIRKLGVVGGNDYANEAFEIAPGSYYFTGTVAIGGSAKPSILAINDSGQVVDQTYLNTNQFASPDYKGTYLGDGLIGFAHLANIVSIFDTSGAIVKDFPVTFGGYTTQVIRTNDDKVAAIGYQFGAGSGSTVSLIKMDTTGATVTIANEYTMPGGDLKPAGIFQDASGNYYLGANLTSISTGNGEPVVIKTDAQGQVIWAKKYSPPGVSDCQIRCIVPTDSGFVIAGYAGPFGSTNMFFAVADSSGNTDCNDTLSSATSSHPNASAATPHVFSAGVIDTLALTPLNPSVPVVSSTLLCIPNAVKDAGSENSIDVYPTVYKNEFNIKTDAVSPYTISMLDIFGRVVFDRIISGNQKIITENLHNGTYVLVVRDQQEKIVLTKRLVKVD